MPKINIQNLTFKKGVVHSVKYEVEATDLMLQKCTAKVSFIEEI